MKKKRGRPPKSEANRLAGRIDLRLSGDDKARYDRAAEKAGLKLSQWIRTCLDAAAASGTIKGGRRRDRTSPAKAG